MSSKKKTPPTKGVVDKKNTDDYKKKYKDVKTELDKTKKDKAALEKELQNCQFKVKSFEKNFNLEDVRKALPDVVEMNLEVLHQQQIIEALGANKALTEKNAELETTIQSLEKMLKDRNALELGKTETSSHKSEMTPVEIPVRDTKDDSKINNKEQMENIKRKLKTDEENISRIEKENTSLKEKLKTAEENISRKTKENATLTKQNSELQNKVVKSKELLDVHDNGKERNTASEEYKILFERNSDFERELEDANKQIVTLQEKVQEGEKKLEDANKQIVSLQEKVQEGKKQLTDVSDVSKQIKTEKSELQRKMEDKEKKIRELEKHYEAKLNEKENEFKEERDSLRRKLNEKENEFKEERDSLRRKLNEKENEFKEERDSLRRERSTLKTELDELTSTNEGLEKRTTKSSKTKELEDEIEGLKTRLSQMAGAKLMSGNPNIADLSDTNRPTKLAEQYSEIYDNEWTNVYEALESNNLSESEIVTSLYGILTEIFNFCSELSINHANLLKDVVTSIALTNNVQYQGKHTDDSQIIPTKLRLLKDLRKAFAPDMTDSIFKLYVAKMKPKHSEKQQMKDYLKKCVTLCWYMSVQDPPVIIDTHQHTGSFNGDIFRTYTKTGKSLAYIVWPPLYLHEGGPMLCKGVAQAK